jgi:hypothetical protein
VRGNECDRTDGCAMEFLGRHTRLNRSTAALRSIR